jgi:hypothetical protein
MHVRESDMDMEIVNCGALSTFVDAGLWNGPDEVE